MRQRERSLNKNRYIAKSKRAQISRCHRTLANNLHGYYTSYDLVWIISIYLCGIIFGCAAMGRRSDAAICVCMEFCWYIALLHCGYMCACACVWCDVCLLQSVVFPNDDKLHGENATSKCNNLIICTKYLLCIDECVAVLHKLIDWFSVWAHCLHIHLLCLYITEEANERFHINENKMIGWDEKEWKMANVHFIWVGIQRMHRIMVNGTSELYVMFPCV